MEPDGDKEEHNLVTLEAVFAAGLAHLPDFLSKSAVGALSRLVTGLVDIPAVALLGYKERIEDRNREARSVRRSLSDAAVAKLIDDEAIVQRTVDRLVSEHVAKQKNREAVATETLKILADKGANTTQDPVDEEWLDSFSAKAERAYSHDARTTWSRVLAGELTTPGSFSRRSLNLLESLEQDEAEKFSDIVKLSFGNIIPSVSIGHSGRVFSNARILEDLGLLSGVTPRFRKPIMQTSGSKVGGLMGRQNYLQVYSSGKPHLEVVFLTEVGRQIAYLIEDIDGKNEREVGRSIGIGLQGQADAAILMELDLAKKPHTPEILFGDVDCRIVGSNVYLTHRSAKPVG